MQRLTLDPIDQIRRYFDFAWQPVPLLPENKKPFIKDWGNGGEGRPEGGHFSQEEIISYYERGTGIGIQVGGISNWIACVDLDDPVLVRLAPKFLPQTLKSGKENEKLPSHWIYRSVGADYLQVKDVDGGEFLAFKASGQGQAHQFVVAPSVHGTKGRYRWFPSFNPAAIADLGAEEIERVIRRLAVAGLIRKYLPDEGRHEYSKAIAGSLLRRGFGADDLAEIHRIVWEDASAPRDGTKNAAKNVHDTADKIADDGRFTARTTLEGIVPGLHDKLIDAAGLRRMFATGGAMGDEEDGSPDDSALARRWLFEHSEIRYSAHGWMGYRGGHWREVEEGLVEQNLTRFLDRAPGVRVSANRVNSVRALAGKHSYVKTDKWDANTNLVVCANGTLDLDTFALREHRPEDFAMGGLPFEYQPEAKAEAWNHFIGSRLPEGYWSFIQEFSGYCLTTDTSHEIALWLVGERGSGKSTFIEGLQAIMGEREGRLSLSDIERSPFALENIVGKTVLTATEQPAGFIKQLDLINTIISGEKVPVNRKNKKITDVRSTAKLVWSMNAKPTVREGGNGIFRRLKIVDFPALSPHLRDPSVKARITTLEPPGILAWAVEGLKRLRERDGFVIPQGVEDSVKDFEHANDPVAQFLEEMCELGEGEGSHVLRGKLYDAYSKWCRARGYKPKNISGVREDWFRLGIREGKTQGDKVYRGVKLVRDPDTYLSTYRNIGDANYSEPGAF